MSVVAKSLARTVLFVYIARVPDEDANASKVNCINVSRHASGVDSPLPSKAFSTISNAVSKSQLGDRWTALG
jgi:hypothetical protein